jgi:isoleucyl-tRNA synthetase
VNRALETARNEKVIGKSLEAKVTIASNDKFNAQYHHVHKLLPDHLTYLQL